MIPGMRRLVVVTVTMFVTSVQVDAQTPSALELVQRIPLADVHGRIDHLAVDHDAARLFVAALGNDSVEVVDLHAGTRIARITGLHEPQGIGYAGSANRLFVANAGGGVDAFEASTLRRLSRTEGLDDADNVRFDAATGTVYIGYAQALAAIDAQSGKLVERIRLAGHPESFQLESAGSRLFVNVPSAAQIAVVDRLKKLVTGTWSTGDAKANFPMALDEANHRLFVATRKPASLLIFDTETGTRTTKLSIDGDADDLFYDAKRKRLYVICGAGAVDIVRQNDAEHYERVGELRTEPGARTGLFVPSIDALFVAVPAHAGNAAEIRVFKSR
jgi:DNA-binding beta-propeller fold protein YncE